MYICIRVYVYDNGNNAYYYDSKRNSSLLGVNIARVEIFIP